MLLCTISTAGSGRSSERIIKGNLRSVDIARVETPNNLYYSFNIIGWGLVADAGYLAESFDFLVDLGMMWPPFLRY